MQSADRARGAREKSKIQAVCLGCVHVYEDKYGVRISSVWQCTRDDGLMCWLGGWVKARAR